MRQLDILNTGSTIDTSKSISAPRTQLDVLNSTTQNGSTLASTPIGAYFDPENFGDKIMQMYRPYDTLDWARKYQANEQGALSEMMNATLRIVPNAMLEVISNIGGIFDVEDWFNVDNETGNWLSRWAQEQKDEINRYALPVYRGNPEKAMDITSSEWWFDNGSNLVSSAAAFVATGYGAALGAASLGSKVARGANWLKTLTTGNGLANPWAVENGVSTLGNAFLLNQAESVSSATQVYDNVYKNQMQKYDQMIMEGRDPGVDRETFAKTMASEAASATMLTNRMNILLNITSANAFLKPFSTKGQVPFQTFWQQMGRQNITRELVDLPTKSRTARKMIGESIQEYLEEDINMIAENKGMAVAEGRDYGWKSALNDALSMQGFEAGFLGALGGAGQTAFTAMGRDIKRLGQKVDGKWMSKNDVQRERYRNQQEVIEKLDQVMQSNNLPEFSAIFNDAAATMDLFEEIQKAEADRNQDKARILSERMLEVQALNAFRSGTAAQLRGVYEAMAKMTDEEAKAKGVDVTKVDANNRPVYKAKIAQALSTLDFLEKTYYDATRYENSDDVFLNRAKDYTMRNASDGLKSELWKSRYELFKRIEEQRKLGLLPTSFRDVDSATQSAGVAFENVVPGMDVPYLFDLDEAITGTQKDHPMYNNNPNYQEAKQKYYEWLKIQPIFAETVELHEKAVAYDKAIAKNEKEYGELISETTQEKIRNKRREANEAKRNEKRQAKAAKKKKTSSNNVQQTASTLNNTSNPPNTPPNTPPSTPPNTPPASSPPNNNPPNNNPPAGSQPNNANNPPAGNAPASNPNPNPTNNPPATGNNPTSGLPNPPVNSQVNRHGFPLSGEASIKSQLLGFVKSFNQADQLKVLQQLANESYDMSNPEEATTYDIVQEFLQQALNGTQFSIATANNSAEINELEQAIEDFDNLETDVSMSISSSTGGTPNSDRRRRTIAAMNKILTAAEKAGIDPNDFRAIALFANSHLGSSRFLRIFDRFKDLYNATADYRTNLTYYEILGSESDVANVVDLSNLLKADPNVEYIYNTKDGKAVDKFVNEKVTRYLERINMYLGGMLSDTVHYELSESQRNKIREAAFAGAYLSRDYRRSATIDKFGVIRVKKEDIDNELNLHMLDANILDPNEYAPGDVVTAEIDWKFNKEYNGQVHTYRTLKDRGLAADASMRKTLRKEAADTETQLQAIYAEIPELETIVSKLRNSELLTVEEAKVAFLKRKQIDQVTSILARKANITELLSVTYENAYIPIVIKKNGKPFMYVHDLDWINEENVFGDNADLRKERFELLKLRNEIFDLSRESKVWKGEITSRSYGKLMKRVEGATSTNEAMPEHATFGIGRNGKIVTNGQELEGDTSIAEREGWIYALFQNKNTVVPIPLHKNTLSDEQADIVIAAIDAWYNYDTRLAEEIENATGFNILTDAGLKSFVSTFLYSFNDYISDKTMDEASKAMSSTTRLFNVNVNTHAIEFAQGAGISYNFISRGTDRELYNRYIQNLRTHIKSMHLRFDVNYLGKVVNFPVMKEGKLSFETIKYDEFIRNNTQTDVMTVQLPNGTRTPFIQPVVRFGQSPKTDILPSTVEEEIKAETIEEGVAAGFDPSVAKLDIDLDSINDDDFDFSIAVAADPSRSIDHFMNKFAGVFTDSTEFSQMIGQLIHENKTATEIETEILKKYCE